MLHAVHFLPDYHFAAFLETVLFQPANKLSSVTDTFFVAIDSYPRQASRQHALSPTNGLHLQTPEPSSVAPAPGPGPGEPGLEPGLELEPEPGPGLKSALGRAGATFCEAPARSAVALATRFISVRPSILFVVA